MDANILVVDDEPEIADLVEVYLKSEGFTVFTCGTAAEVSPASSALRSTKRLPFCSVLAQSLRLVSPSCTLMTVPGST